MISFNFRGRDAGMTQELLVAQQRMSAALMDGMATHAVRGDDEDFATLQDDLKSARERMEADTVNPEELMILTGTALRTVQDYNRRTALSLQGQARELQKIVSMLTATVLSLSETSEGSATRLQNIEKQIERASGGDDMRKLKDRLSDCLMTLREEQIRQKLSAEQARQSVARVEGPAHRAAIHTDPTTGLGSRPAAEAALAAALDDRRPVYAAVFGIEHLHNLNLRFGRAVGDEIIMHMAQHLAQNLSPADMVFRWSGPCFLALVERQDTMERVRRELSPVARARLEKTVQAKDRTVLLPMHIAWSLYSVLEHEKTSLLITKIDQYTATQVAV